MARCIHFSCFSANSIDFKMINSTWEFVKRHRAKIATAATVVSGIYATKKIFDRQGYQTCDLLKQFSHYKNSAGDPMLQVF
jgi:hypothetical protein